MFQPINARFNIYTSKEFKNFSPIKKKRLKFDIRTYRCHVRQKLPVSSKALVASGSAAGTLLPAAVFTKLQNKKIFNLNYGLKEIILISTGAIAGGILTGKIADKKEHGKQKIHEGVFQFLNTIIPALLIIPTVKLCNKVKFLNNNFAKITASLGVLFGGMKMAAHLSNKINDPKDLEPDRKLGIKDAAANIDDALGTLALAKIPAAKNMQINKILPIIYGWCGYRAGISN